MNTPDSACQLIIFNHQIFTNWSYKMQSYTKPQLRNTKKKENEVFLFITYFKKKINFYF